MGQLLVYDVTNPKLWILITFLIFDGFSSNLHQYFLLFFCYFYNKLFFRVNFPFNSNSLSTMSAFDMKEIISMRIICFMTVLLSWFALDRGQTCQNVLFDIALKRDQKSNLHVAVTPMKPTLKWSMVCHSR